MKLFNRTWPVALVVAMAFAVFAPRAGAAVSLRVDLYKGTVAPENLVVCGGSVSGVGNIIARMIVVNDAQQPVQVRRDYDPVVNGVYLDPWYGTHSTTVSVGETQVVEMVQDLDQSATAHRFLLKAIGIASESCEISATNYPVQTEGTKSLRSGPGLSGVEVRIDIVQYGTTNPVPCDSTMPAGRVQATFMARRTAGQAQADWHWHMERPGDPGPDQDGNSANNRFMEEGFTRVTVGTGWTKVASIVSDSRPGTNVFHFGQQNSTQAEPYRVSPEVFCSYTTG